MMKRLILIIVVFWALNLFCQAPVNPYLVIAREEPNRLEILWNAVTMVESNHDPLAYCIDVNGLPSIGIAQIQKSRMDDYNRLTGKNYQHQDAFDPVISKEIFMYYTMLSNTLESAAREWNGGPKWRKKEQTKDYWNKVKKHL